MKIGTVFLSAIVVGLTAASLSGQGGRGGAPASQPPPPPGDAANGKALYQTNKCGDCHRVGDSGSRVGPDLSNVGQLRSVHVSDPGHELASSALNRGGFALAIAGILGRAFL